MKNSPDHARASANLPRVAGLILAAACVLTPARAQTYAFSLLAGSGVVLDHADGTGGNARFFNPTAIAIDAGGTLYVADGGDHTVRKISPDGNVTTLAGASGEAGNNDGTGSGARFQYPYALAVDGAGNVFVTDTGAHTVRKISPGGSVSTIAGSAGLAGSADGVGLGAQFNAPQGIAVDAAGNVYVADTNNSTIRKIGTNGAVSTIAGAVGQMGGNDGGGGNARFDHPAGLAIDAAGNLYVADFNNSTIRKITTNGSVSTIAGAPGQSGGSDGVAGGARLDHPAAVAVDAAGNVYVADTSGQTIRRISTDAVVSTLAGKSGFGGQADGGGASARFFYPFGIAVRSDGSTLFVADTGNHTIRVVSAGGSVSTGAGAVGVVGSNDGNGSSARFAYPAGVAVDSSGNVYVADHNNHVIRKVTADGNVSTLAGAAGLAGSADGAGGGARFNGPSGVAVDGSGNVYVADMDNHTIRKITSSGSVSTLAGASGAAGGSDGTGGNARFNRPQGVAVDGAGNVYVADSYNSAIRKITPAGSVSTLAGALGQNGSNDGNGGGARFNGPSAVAVAPDGSIFVTDFFNATIRKVTAEGSVTTYAGAAGQTGVADGSGSLARFNQPYALAVDGGGNVYVADTYNRAIRRITPSGVTTLNGSGARFYYPQGLAVDGAGNFYVSDGDNQAITKGVLVVAPAANTPVAGTSVTAGQSATFSLSPAAGTNYQWQVSADGGATWTDVANDGTYSGASSAKLTIGNVSTALNGRQYRVKMVNAAGFATSAAATLTVTGGGGGTTFIPPGSSGSARLAGLSLRSYVGTDDKVVIVGITIGGSGSKQTVIRAVGPTLATSYNVDGVLSNPTLTLFNSDRVAIAANTGWGTAPNAAIMNAAFDAVGDFPFPANSADSAIVQALPSGVYTAQITGVNRGTGIALAEFYDAGGDASTRLSAASTRALVGTGSGVLIAGFTIGGSGKETVSIRGIGPGLVKYGIDGALAKPQLTLYDSTGTVVATNTGWGGDPALAKLFDSIGQFALDPASADCALVVSLPSGAYTVQLSGVNQTTGVGLIELYEVP